MKRVYFLDIETALINARVFRTGLQTVNFNQLDGYTRLLTAAWGTMWDLYMKGEEGVRGVSNHTSAEFKKDPLDDTYVLQRLWKVLDHADVIVAHNAAFDRGWIMGRFLQLGWPLPSKFSTVCTLKGLRKYNFTSKKLDALSQQLVGTCKLDTNFDLWVRCSKGERSAFKEMLEYNKGDVYDTLFKVYLATAQYYPDYCVDFADYSDPTPQCKVTGEPLTIIPTTYHNRKTGCEYYLYENKDLGITYRDRYNIYANKANQGFLVHHI
jgi:hypothetical protein